MKILKGLFGFLIGLFSMFTSTSNEAQTIGVENTSITELNAVNVKPTAYYNSGRRGKFKGSMRK